MRNERKAMTVLVCGSLAIDTVLTLDAPFDSARRSDGHLDGHVNAPHVRRTFGGCAGNIAYALQKLSEHPVPVASIGLEYGTMSYRAHLEWHGIETVGVHEVEGERTAQAFIVNDSEGCQLTMFHAGATAHAAANALPDGVKADLATVSPDARAAMLAHCAALETRKIPTLFDPGQAIGSLNAADIEHCARHAHWIVANENEWAALERIAGLSPDEVAARRKTAIVTGGAQGLRVHGAGGAYRIDAARADAVVDPTGCGDAWRAGFIHGLARGLGTMDAARLGAAAASIAVQYHGGQNETLSETALAERYERAYGKALSADVRARTGDPE